MAIVSAKPEASLRSIARVAGVSPTAVSMALRDSGRISTATRQRIKKIAQLHGYRPDPVITRLMLHVRARGSKRLIKGTICALMAEDWGSTRKRKYSQAIVDAARRHADSLGFAFDVLPMEPAMTNPGHLRRMLRSRGVDGMLVAPLPAPLVLSNDLGWDELSVVAATYSMLRPDFHRVVPHQFDNMLLLCDQLTRRGFRRIGLVSDAASDQRVHHCASAAVTWHNLFGSGSEFVRPLLVEEFVAAPLAKWLREERPDVVIVLDEERAVKLTSVVLSKSEARPTIVCSSWTPGQQFAGIDERPAEVGARGVELLASMILHNEKGVPRVGTVTMVGGIFVEQGLP